MLALVGTIVLLAPSPYAPPILRALESSFFLNRLWLFIVHLVLGPSTVEGGSVNPLRWAWTRSKVEARAAKRERGRSASMKALLGTIKRSLSRSSAAQTEVDGTARPEELGAEEKKDEWDEEPVVFRFEVMENQRWWLALDWTGTLAPGDRPIWCVSLLDRVFLLRRYYFADIQSLLLFFQGVTPTCTRPLLPPSSPFRLRTPRRSRTLWIPTLTRFGSPAGVGQKTTGPSYEASTTPTRKDLFSSRRKSPTPTAQRVQVPCLPERVKRT